MYVRLYGCQGNVVASFDRELRVINYSSLEVDSIACFDPITNERNVYLVAPFNQASLSAKNKSFPYANNLRFQLLDNNGKILFDTIPNIKIPELVYQIKSNERPTRHIFQLIEFTISEDTMYHHSPKLYIDSYRYEGIKDFY